MVNLSRPAAAGKALASDDLLPHPRQDEFVESPAKRKAVRAGRRGGKTRGAVKLAKRYFDSGRRVLYATPTQEQIDAFWEAIKRVYQPQIDGGQFYKNETRHLIEKPGTPQRIRAKTAWDADTLRGDYADLLILDEYQLMAENAWNEVGAPMLLDNDGDAVFIYTPPSLHSRHVSRASDPMHAAKLFKKAQADTTGRWAAFHFSSHDNPYISARALGEIVQDMTRLAVRQEIMAEDVDEAPGALWNRAQLELHRVSEMPLLARVVTAVDPSATARGDEAGVIVAGIDRRGDGFVIDDRSLRGSPNEWALAAVSAYNVHKADALLAESNNGGEMVAVTIGTVKGAPPVKLIHASRGKQTRAEPVAALYEQGRVYHVGAFPLLEDELCQWTPGDESPNRLDALVWALTELMLSQDSGSFVVNYRR